MPGVSVCVIVILFNAYVMATLEITVVFLKFLRLMDRNK